MAGLLAWAADVVGGKTDDLGYAFGGESGPPLIFSTDQRDYYSKLERQAASLNRSIQDLRLGLPPSDLSQRLPHILAHSVASNNALTLQLHAHSSTKEQAQLREATLLEENAAFRKAILACEGKIQEKRSEAESIKKKLKELNEIEDESQWEVREMKASSLPATSPEPHRDSEMDNLKEKLENKKGELKIKEEQFLELEKRWSLVQERSLKQPSSAQREKMLDRQIHSSLEQLAAKQVQAESLATEVREKGREVEKLNGLWKKLENSSSESSFERNRGERNYFIRDKQQKVALMRPLFVVYIFFLHFLVFIKIFCMQS